MRHARHPLRRATSPDCWHPRGKDAPHILRPILHQQLPALAPTCVMSTQIAARHTGPALRCGPDKTGNNPARDPNCPPGSGTPSLHLAIDATDCRRRATLPK